MVWAEVGICVGGKLKLKGGGLSQDSEGNASWVVSVVAARALSCGSRFMFGTSVRNYPLYWWMPQLVSNKLSGVGWRSSGFGLPRKAA